jgi:hypothetical protein
LRALDCNEQRLENGFAKFQFGTQVCPGLLRILEWAPEGKPKLRICLALPVSSSKDNATGGATRIRSAEASTLQRQLDGFTILANEFRCGPKRIQVRAPLRSQRSVTSAVARGVILIARHPSLGRG